MFSNFLDITGFFVGVLINLLLIALICYYFKRKIDNLEYSQSEQAKTLYKLISSQQSSVMMGSESRNIVMGDNDIMNGLDLTQLHQEYDDNEDNTDEEEEEDEDEDEDEVEDEVEDEDEDEEEDENEDEEDEIIEGSEQPEYDTTHLIQTFQIASNSETPIATHGSNMSDNVEVKHVDYGIVQGAADVELDEPEVNRSLSDITVANELSETLDASVEETVVGSAENYEKMTVKELKNVLAEKGVHAKSSMNKSDIINILKGATDMNMNADEEM